MSRARPGIRRSRVRTPALAHAELHLLMPLPPKATKPLGQKFANRLRAWFYGWLRSRAARWIKAGL